MSEALRRLSARDSGDRPAGGLLVGAALTQRPELIRAAVAQVPNLDLMQCRKDSLTLGIASLAVAA
jgi:prolyl oligopeptidase PreP (S9A serine peptidase family)